MKFFPPDNMNFVEHVQTYFLERTRKGIVLSSRDVALIYGWRKRGATVGAVCQGIDDAIGDRNELPRDLFSCRKYVDKRVKQLGFLEGSPQGVPVVEPERVPAAVAPVRRSFHEIVMQRLSAAQSGSIREAFVCAYRRAEETVIAYAEVPEGLFLESLPAIESTLFSQLYDALDDAERAEIDREIEAQAEAHDRMSPGARHEHIQSWRRRLLLRDHGVVGLDFDDPNG